MKERTGANSAKQRLLFTLAAVTVYRAGLHVSLPGVNRQALQESLSHYSPSLAQTYNEVTGGALSTAAVFSLGITPYIVASILVLLMSGAVLRLRRIRDKRAGADPAFDRLIYGVVALVAALQAWGMAVFLETMQSPSGLPVVSDPGLGFRILAVVSMAAGALLLAWIADQISWKGIANGVAVLVLVDMAASLWQPALRELDLLLIGHRLLWQWVVLFGFAAGLLALSFAVISAKRYLPLTYVGTAPTTAPQAWTPRVTLRANTVGILPIWLAATLLYVLTGTGSLAWGSAAYWVLHCALIVVFAYVWTAVTFKSSDLVSQLARYGFALADPDARDAPEDYIDRIVERVVLPYALLLAGLMLVPHVLHSWLGTNEALTYLVGPPLLIVAAVAVAALDGIRTEHEKLATNPSDSVKGRDDWVSVFQGDTELEVDLVRGRLARSGIRSVRRSNRVICLTGTLAFWEASRPTYPSLTIHRSLGAGRVYAEVPRECAGEAERIVARLGEASDGGS